MNRKEKISAYIRSKQYIPLTFEEMAVMLDVPLADLPEFERIIDEIIEDGLAFKSKKGRLMPSSAQNHIKGVFCGSEKGFGFVDIGENSKDIFIPSDFVNGAMHGDTVLIKILSPENGDKR